MKLFSIKIVATLALHHSNEVAFAGFLKGTAEVQSDVNGSRCADPCLTARCNNPNRPYCQPDDDGCSGYSCVATCDICDYTTCFVGTCVPNDDCSASTCAGVTDEEGKDVKDDTEAEEEDDVKVQSDADESEGCYNDPCVNVQCNGPRHCESKSDCSTKCVNDTEEEEEDDVKVEAESSSSGRPSCDICNGVRCFVGTCEPKNNCNAFDCVAPACEMICKPGYELDSGACSCFASCNVSPNYCQAVYGNDYICDDYDPNDITCMIPDAASMDEEGDDVKVSSQDPLLMQE